MRLAVFCPYLPAPATSGGRIRMNRLLRRLGNDHELHLFAKASRTEAVEAAGSLDLACFEGQVVVKPGVDPAGLLAEPERVVRGTPRRLWDAYVAAHRARPFEGAIIEHAHAGRYAHALGVPFVLDEHNVESRYLAAKQRKSALLAPLQRVQVRRLEVFEQALWRAAARVITVSEEEATVIARRSGVRAEVISNGADLNEISYVAAEYRDPATLLFVGLLDHPPNVQAALELANDVLPRVRARVPQARLVLCGKNPSADVLRLQSDTVEVTGSVPSVKPYWSKASVFANPLRGGAGTSLKVVEALASGTPMVSTAVGVRGFAQLKEGEHYLHAEHVEAFVDCICAVLERPGNFAAMTRAGRALAQQLDWSALAERYAQIVADAFDTR